MKKTLILVIALLTQLSIYSQEGEIIYTDIEPDSIFALNSHNQTYTDFDIDLDGEPDIGFAQFTPSVGGTMFIYAAYGNWRIGVMYSGYSDTITNFDGWMGYNMTFSVYSLLPEPDEFYPVRFVVRNTAGGNYYYGWLGIEMKWLNVPGTGYTDITMKFKDMAYCTIANYPLLYGQTNLVDVGENLQGEIKHYVYPNPVKNQFQMQLPTGAECSLVQLYNLQGRLVSTQDSSFESISTEHLAKGTYLVKVTLADGKVYTEKIVKE